MIQRPNSLREINLNTDLILFDETLHTSNGPILLAVPHSLLSGSRSVPQGIQLKYRTQNYCENWTLQTRGQPLLLFPISSRIPESPTKHFSLYAEPTDTYNSEMVVTSRQEIIDYLTEREGFFQYAKAISQGKLLTERKGLLKLLENWGMVHPRIKFTR